MPSWQWNPYSLCTLLARFEREGQESADAPVQIFMCTLPLGGGDAPPKMVFPTTIKHLIGRRSRHWSGATLNATFMVLASYQIQKVSVLLQFQFFLWDYVPCLILSPERAAPCASPHLCWSAAGLGTALKCAWPLWVHLYLKKHYVNHVVILLLMQYKSLWHSRDRLTDVGFFWICQNVP